MNKNQGRRISRNGKRQLKGDLEIDKMVQCCFRDGYKILARWFMEKSRSHKLDSGMTPKSFQDLR